MQRKTCGESRNEVKLWTLREALEIQGQAVSAAITGSHNRQYTATFNSFIAFIALV
jgi:hypothetical protein